jgi:MoaA/NifB/PqqE/SkfB family radical SAM enzyme
MKHVILTLTYACQLRCKMCGQVNLPEGKELAGGELDANLAISRLEEIPTLKTCYLFGGEPLLHSRFFDIVEYLRSRGVWTGFSTNGLLLGKYHERIVDADIDMLSVSIDSHYPEIHDEIRGLPGLFEKACGHLRQLLDYRAHKGAAKPSVKVHFTILPGNIGEMREYYETFTTRFPELDMIKFHFPRFVTPTMAEEYSRVLRQEFGSEPTSHLGNFLNIESFTDENCEQLHENLQYLLGQPKASVTGPADVEGIRHYFKSPDLPPKGARCACFKSMTVQPDGSVVNCADYPDLVYGNIHSNSLLDIWEGEIASKWRAYLEQYGNPGVLARCSRLYPGINSKAK